MKATSPRKKPSAADAQQVELDLGYQLQGDAGEAALGSCSPSETLAADAESAAITASTWRTDPKAAARAWLNSRRSRAYREHSLDQYVSMVGAAATWWTKEGSGATLLTATEADVLQFLQSRGRGDPPTLSATTSRRYLGLLNDVFQHLATSGWRSDNPVPNLLRQPHLGAPDRAAPTYLQQDLADQYIAWVRQQPLQSWRDHRDRALRLIFLATGITVEEAKKLRPHDVYLGANAPGIDVAAHHRVKARRVPIAAWAVEELAAWSAERAAKAEHIGVTATAGPFFPGHSTWGPKPKEAPALGSTEIYEIVRPGMEHVLGADAARLGAQTLRNTFAVRQMKAGATDDSVMRWLGLETTFSLSALRRQIELHAGERVV